MKFVRPNLKTMVSVGGANSEMQPLWYSMVENSTNRMNFARNILSFLQTHNLNGVGKCSCCAYLITTDKC